MKYIINAVITALLSSSPVYADDYPPAGEVVNSGCSSNFYGTEWIQVSDGNGGTYSEHVENSPNCTVGTPPEAGTLVLSGCSKDIVGVKWWVYNDGSGGRYSELDYKSVECGWKTPIMKVTVVKGSGDRFDPVVIDVDYTDVRGKPAGWGMVHVKNTIGRAERVDYRTIHIYGDGSTDDGIFSIGQFGEWTYQFEPEPRCELDVAANGQQTDCQGYNVARTATKPLIYYGEDDERIVEWEIAFVWIDYAAKTDDKPYGWEGVTKRHEVGSNRWIKAESLVEKYNKAYERSGVHVRFVLNEGNVTDGYYGNSGYLDGLKDDLDADIILGFGNSCDQACGCARPVIRFLENKGGAIPSGTSVCGWTTDLHEIGHMVSLAHGPENSGYPAIGYIFPQFGHGWASFCGRTFPDLMSYDYGSLGHHNSTLTCAEMYYDRREIYPDDTDPAGYRDFADAAYALNRVRYDVSLINCGDTCSKIQNSPRTSFADDLPVVIDRIDDIPGGRERYERFQQEINPTISEY